VDIVPFGQMMTWDDQGRDYGVIWEDPRDVFRVVAVFTDAAAAPKRQTVRVDYWQSQWPHRRIPRDRPSGAGGSGWLDAGDWFQGKWQTADTKLKVDGATYIFTFDPINAKEFSNLKDFAATYRSTLKLRIAADTPLGKVKSLKVYTDSVWRPLDVEIQWGATAQKEQVWDGRLEVFNGSVEGVERIVDTSAVEVDRDNTWRSRVRDRLDGIRARIHYAETKGQNSFDETVVTVRASAETFSFAPADLLRWKHIFIPDFGVLIRRAGEDVTYESADRDWREGKDKDLYTRVFDAPEQTLTQAWDDTPLKDHHYIPLSFEGGRQHFGVEADGSVFCRNNWLARIRGKDTDRCKWDGDKIVYRLGLPDSRPIDRHCVDGCLPMVVAVWERTGVRYRQTAFVIPLMGVPDAGGRIWGDDTLVLMARVDMEVIDRPEAEAGLDLTVSHRRGDKQLILDRGLVRVAGGGDTKIPRMLVRSPDPPDRYSLADQEGRIAYRAKLTADAPKVTLDVVIPYITLDTEREEARLRSLDFEEGFRAVRAYWQGRIDAGAQIRTPEPMINDFYKAHVSHLLINTEREVGNSDRYMAKVGTFSYGVFSNESCMMISDLDRRGYHEPAERALQTWLHYQGTVGLPGDFSTTDGQFYGAGGYEAGGYNQHHGWVLWCLGEHYWYTRDRGWLARAAPHIVKACDWIIKERARTVAEGERLPIRAIERGLLPPGRLEDIGDWRCWLSTNVYSWWGMRNAAAALADAGHPEGQRLGRQAEAYRKDLLTAFGEAMRRSPVVRLRDGRWIPHVPADVHRRGRSFGWITETLEGAIHLVRCGALDPRDRLSAWIVKDFEDNLYLSEQFGYHLTGDEFERYWFSRGGISMQANLLCNPIPYLLRDEPKHFLRAYFNAFAVSFFADTRMMTEHALPSFGDWRGDHYKSSDEANSTYWLRLMFIQERLADPSLWLGGAIPRYWLADGQTVSIENAATYFGPMSMKITSRVSRGEIEMTFDPPRRNPPKRIRARFRHPDGRRMTRVEVNAKSHDKFDPKTDWVELPQCTKQTRIVAHYD